MCLLAYNNDPESNTRVRRRLATMAILLISISLAIGFLHPLPGPDAGFFDFLRGLMVGIALVFSITAVALCARRPSSGH